MIENGIFWHSGDSRKWEMRIYFFSIVANDNNVNTYVIEYFDNPEDALKRYREVINEKIDKRYHYLYGV